MKYREYYIILKTPGTKPWRIKGPHIHSPWMCVTGKFATLKKAKAAIDRHLESK